MKPNNLFFVSCTENSFYRAWMEFLTPYHKLTSREKDVAARILQQYFRFRGNVDDADVIHDLIWSKKSRCDMMESLKISRPHFQMVLAKLESTGFLHDGNIEPRFIPHMTFDGSRFLLQVCFDWSSQTNPIHSGT